MKSNNTVRNVEVISNNTGLTVISEQIEVTDGVNVVAKAYDLLTRRLGVNKITARMNYHVSTSK